MEFLKSVWNHQADPEKSGALQVRALRWLAVFLGGMVCCTVVSRAADTLTIAMVSTKTPDRMAIAHTLTVDGKLEAVDLLPVTAASGALVRSVEVTPGDQVKEGDLLFTFDTTELEKDLARRQVELQTLYTKISIQRESEELAARDREEEARRRAEDYYFTKEQQEISADHALDAMNEARRELRDYDGSDVDDDESYEARKRALRASYRNAMREYEQALSQAQEAVTKAERNIEDAEKEVISRDADLMALEARSTELEISWIRELLSTGGEVYAPADGIVTTVSAEVGKLTGSDAALWMTATGGVRFTAEITEDQQKHVARGSSVTLQIPGESKKLDLLQVNSLTPVTGGYRITVELPAGAGEPDLTATADIVQRSEIYPACVPLSALYGENNQYYVLTIRETESALGVEQILDRVEVTILEQNESLAAVSGALNQTSKVVIQSDRPVSGGDRVRLESTL